ncbi:LOB domain-containing protein 22-like [Cynara cardunculus var. scolymus]|uniref:LOB domain-containing protein 22-like n=1 Tax=Cynara cardunculus var. scolymus TaxID=59895 RepID=UPI000D62A879|nr:LOB domain-containing protein 22-like [Cynara cardunculus var. scolymus]
MTNHNHHHHRLIHHHNHHLLPPHTTRSTSTIQACAACRYQRRKCAPDCILAPYFPHDRQRQFQNAHKLFGVSNITKIIRHLDQPQKDEAMRTIIYQADVRAQDPVGGCYRIIRELQRQIDVSCSDLEIVLQQLAFCRTLSVQNHTHLNHDQIVIDEVNCDIHVVNNSDDPVAGDERRRHSLDFDLRNYLCTKKNVKIMSDILL